MAKKKTWWIASIILLLSMGCFADMSYIKITSFNDTNNNGVKDGADTFLIGWNYRINGSGINVLDLTDYNGETGLIPLPYGKYTVTEFKNNNQFSHINNSVYDWSTYAYSHGPQTTVNLNSSPSRLVYFAHQNREEINYETIIDAISSWKNENMDLSGVIKLIMEYAKNAN
jgi:hypothetical protein